MASNQGFLPTARACCPGTHPDTAPYLAGEIQPELPRQATPDPQKLRASSFWAISYAALTKSYLAGEAAGSAEMSSCHPKRLVLCSTFTARRPRVASLSAT